MSNFLEEHFAFIVSSFFPHIFGWVIVCLARVSSHFLEHQFLVAWSLCHVRLLGIYPVWVIVGLCTFIWKIDFHVDRLFNSVIHKVIVLMGKWMTLHWRSEFRKNPSRFPLLGCLDETRDHFLSHVFSWGSKHVFKLQSREVLDNNCLLFCRYLESFFKFIQFSFSFVNAFHQPLSSILHLCQSLLQPYPEFRLHVASLGVNAMPYSMADKVVHWFSPNLFEINFLDSL